MVKWSFPSRNFGQIDGFENPGHDWFKGDPLKALAREICQNSLDAVRDEKQPVRVEFDRKYINTSSFPGTYELIDIIEKCAEFWKAKNDDRINNFTDSAIKILKKDKLSVLRISDYNTIGLKGAFETSEITPWVGLVKSVGVNIKSTNTAAGSKGVGKAAAFVNSDLQTVFYRTKDLDGNTAAQGVASLMAFSDGSYGDDDPVRRAVGFYGNPSKNLPISKMEELDSIYNRAEIGTDIFIPGFHWTTAGSKSWVEIMTGEILENFLMSIYNDQLSVQIENEIIDKAHLNGCIVRNQKSAKNAYCFNKVLTAKPEEIVDEYYDFHGMGKLRLRLLYAADMNKKILVVRKSGMKISEISGLPKGISYTGILELQGDELNAYFRKMENPTHDKWEPKRHPDQMHATTYKYELEEWVKSVIRKKVEDMAGAELSVDTGNIFNTADNSENFPDASKKENIIDSSQKITYTMRSKKTSPVNRRDGSGSRKVRGTIDDKGDLTGHRHRDGMRANNRTGRKGHEEEGGKDTVFTGVKRVNVKARIISVGEGVSRLICTSEETINRGNIEVFAIGENGKSIPIHINSIVAGTNNANLSNGKIAISDVNQGEKITVDFQMPGNQHYAMGVTLNGNKE